MQTIKTEIEESIKQLLQEVSDNVKTRYRIETRLFHKPLLVLQIGEEYNSGDSDDMPPSCHNKVYTSWRDAVVEDLVLLGGGSNEI